MWNQKPLSSPGGSPKVGGQQQRGNPFAASRPLAGAGAAAPAGAPPVSTAHHTAGYPPAQPRAPTHPPAGPPHQPTYGGIPQPTQQTHPPAPGVVLPHPAGDAPAGRGAGVPSRRLRPGRDGPHGRRRHPTADAAPADAAADDAADDAAARAAVDVRTRAGTHADDGRT